MKSKIQKTERPKRLVPITGAAARQLRIIKKEEKKLTIYWPEFFNHIDNLNHIQHEKK